MPTLGSTIGALLVLACGGTDSSGGGGEEPGGEPTTDRPAFYTTLDRLPVDFNTASTMLGAGWAGGEVLAGQLSVDGRFEGLDSPATEAHLRRARPGLRGPVIVALQVVGEGDGRAGVVEGTLPLDRALEEALRAGELYVQIASESNPDGVLRGWLMSSR